MDCEKRTYIVHWGDQVLSLANVLVDANISVEVQLQCLTIELIQQNSHSALVSSFHPPHGTFKWGFKEKDTWFKIVHTKDLLSHSTLGFFGASSQVLVHPDEHKEEDETTSDGSCSGEMNTNNGVNELESPKERLESHHQLICPLEFLFFPRAHLMPNVPYFFCDLLMRGGEIWALRNGMAERLYIPPTSRCKYRWCNAFLDQRVKGVDGETFLVVRGLSRPVLAIYCSAKCAMLDRKEMLAHSRRLTLQSFRFLVQQHPDDVRLLRLLRVVHDDLEQGIRT